MDLICSHCKKVIKKGEGFEIAISGINGDTDEEHEFDPSYDEYICRENECIQALVEDISWLNK